MMPGSIRWNGMKAITEYSDDAKYRSYLCKLAMHHGPFIYTLHSSSYEKIVRESE